MTAPIPNVMTLTDNARDTIADWANDDGTNRQELIEHLLILIRMGARGHMESPNLIVCETPTLQVGLFRDRKGGISLNS